MRQLVARSISRPVQTFLSAAAASPWQVLAVFDRACDLVAGGGDHLAPAGDVIALVLPEIGDGPLNVVVEAQPGVFAAVEPRTPAWIGGGALHVGPLEIRLGRASIWEPRPDWQRLRRTRERIDRHLPLVHELSLRHAPSDSLIPLLVGRVANPPYGARIREALRELHAAWPGEAETEERLEVAATRLAGLGSGLTPAGDDFLVGLMLRAWLAHPRPDPFCRRLLDVAVPRTTTLSAAFLRAAARGECSAAWHTLLTAMAGENERQLAAAVERVLSYGHTSGADVLAGFLWAPGE